jgi:thymidylate kinase
MEPVKWVTLEGLIGVGKSSQMALLRESLTGEDVVFLEEPVDKWMSAGLLQGFYSRRLSASVFQFSVLVSLFGPLFSAVLRRPKLIVSERSPFSNSAVFARANLDGEELAAYHYTLRELMGALPPVEVTSIYLVTNVDTAMERVQRRNRDTESGIKQENMYLLHDLHSRLEYSLPKGGSLVRVSADGSIEETALKISDVVQRVLLGNCT